MRRRVSRVLLAVARAQLWFSCTRLSQFRLRGHLCDVDLLHYVARSPHVIPARCNVGGVASSRSFPA
eukprot:7898288-Pyramimonas_sp.AAC.1